MARDRRWRQWLSGVVVVVVAVEVLERIALARLDGRAAAERDLIDVPPVRHHRLATPDGGSLHVADQGEGRVVLLLHGHGAALDTFDLVTEGLVRRGWRTVAFDLRGFGRSSAVHDEVGFEALVDDVAVVLETLDLHDVLLVGHSMGGALALALVLRHPELAAARVRGLVLIASTARGPADTRRNRLQVRIMDTSAVERIGLHPRHGVVLTRFNFGDKPRRTDIEAARAVGFLSPVSPRRGLARRLLGIDFVDRLAAVQLPVLLLVGTRDRVVAPQESVRLAELIPQAQLVVLEGAGHMLPLERAGEVVAQIVAFGDTVVPPEGGPS